MGVRIDSGDLAYLSTCVMNVFQQVASNYRQAEFRKSAFFYLDICLQDSQCQQQKQLFLNFSVIKHLNRPFIIKKKKMHILYDNELNKVVKLSVSKTFSPPRDMKKTNYGEEI